MGKIEKCTICSCKTEPLLILLLRRGKKVSAGYICSWDCFDEYLIRLIKFRCKNDPKFKSRIGETK